jgi:hypothetical protein
MVSKYMMVDISKVKYHNEMENETFARMGWAAVTFEQLTEWIHVIIEYRTHRLIRACEASI